MSLVDADKASSIIQYFATVLWTPWRFNRLFFPYVYPVYLFTFIDYLVRCSCFLIVLVYNCTWFCDDIVCILQAQQDGNDVTAALLVHFDMSFQPLKTAGPMPLMAGMSSGLFDYKNTDESWSHATNISAVQLLLFVILSKEQVLVPFCFITIFRCWL